MLLSSRSSDRRCGSAAPPAAQESPPDVDPASGEGEHGLGVLASLKTWLGLSDLLSALAARGGREVLSLTPCESGREAEA
jgi:hypothetical protein